MSPDKAVPSTEPAIPWRCPQTRPFRPPNRPFCGEVPRQSRSVHRTGHSVEKSPDKAVLSTEPAIPWRSSQSRPFCPPNRPFRGEVPSQGRSVHRTGHSVEKSPDKAVPSTEPAILWRNVQQDFSVALLFLDRLVSGKELVLNFQINKSKLLLFFLLMLKIANREFVK